MSSHSPVNRSATPPSTHSDCNDAWAAVLATAEYASPPVSHPENSAAMEGYFEDGEGWEEDALVKAL
ncbi:hypothetical protein DNK48_11815 [Streptomyces malaysiensis subsp. malaysiensis]|nr:hypothetical protein DNK48_11815 [Streptomyces malaysiensis]